MTQPKTQITTTQRRNSPFTGESIDANRSLYEAELTVDKIFMDDGILAINRRG